MKFCTHCGAQLVDEAVICVNCGCATDDYKPKQAQAAAEDNSSTLKLIAKIFMIIGCVASASFFFIPLCWTIPMTVKYWNDVKYNRPTSTAFKVCALLFVNMIAGILMLCDNSDNSL